MTSTLRRGCRPRCGCSSSWPSTCSRSTCRPTLSCGASLEPLLPQEVAARIEEADEGELIGRRRLEAPQRGSDGQLPATGRAGGIDGVGLRAIAEGAREPERLVVTVLLVEAEIRDHGAH